MATNDPRIATEGQWGELIDNVQTCARIGRVVTEPTDVAFVGTANIIDQAVTADKMAEGAVTKGKVDLTTFKTFSGLPTAKITMANAGADTVLNLYRVGGMVYAIGTFVSAGLGSYDQIPIGNVVPAGYRPSTAVCDSDGNMYLPFTTTTYATNGAMTSGGWTINNDGRMKFSNAVGYSGSARFMYNGCWPTEDEWPS